MWVRVELSCRFDAPLERVWAVLGDIRELGSFVGWGPIPGIREAVWARGDGQVGAVRRVENLDGTTHHEEVMSVSPLAAMEDRIYDMSSPLRFLVRDVRDHFALERDGAGTRLARSFRFELKTPLLWPLGALVARAMRRALARHHEELAKRMKT